MAGSVLIAALLLVTDVQAKAGGYGTVAAREYLGRAGYVQDAAADTSNIQPALLQFQKFTGLQQTGRHWRGNSVTYNIFKGSSKMSFKELDAVVKKAFAFWTDVSNLRVAKVTTPFPLDVHIGIRFEAGAHGDGTPFDGPGGALAHTSFPPHGRVHLDDAEPWTTRPDQNPYNRDLLSVLTHELGHSLGLAHSHHREAVMYPYYKLYAPGSFTLTADDMEAIQALYGKKLLQLDSNLHQSAHTSKPQITTTPKPVVTMLQLVNGKRRFKYNKETTLASPQSVRRHANNIFI